MIDRPYPALGRLLGEIFAEVRAAPADSRRDRAIARVHAAGYETVADLVEDLETRLSARAARDHGVPYLDELADHEIARAGEHARQRALEERRQVDATIPLLTPQDKTGLILLSACTMLPIWDRGGRLEDLGVVNERGTITVLGRAIAERLLEDASDAIADEARG